MKTEQVNPDLSNFVKSLRDIGYSYEIAVADIVDNSITAKAEEIKIFTIAEPNIIFAMLDDGIGMTNNELIEAMRLASKNPDDTRDKNDLGRFGLGLKTASFSQCRKLTVVSKKSGNISAKQWDLDYISAKNEWLLISLSDYNKLPLFNKLNEQNSGTLVVWEQIDRIQKKDYTDNIEKLRNHLSLVFHRFLDGSARFEKLNISINDNLIKPFNPFNEEHPATQCISQEKTKLYNSEISITPYILPHHSKLSQQEYERYSTEDGYTKSQGFYLYRANRLLIYGTWWGMHKAIDAHKLVRVKIDIPNNQDKYWGIDIKKSTARPTNEIRDDLKRIICLITEKGSRPYTGRGRKIQDNSIIKFWQLIPVNNDFRFVLNPLHPIYKHLLLMLRDDEKELLDLYLKGLQAYLPLEAIQAELQQTPHKIKQESTLSQNDVAKLAIKLKAAGLSEEYIDSLLKTEIFKNNKELLINE